MAHYAVLTNDLQRDLVDKCSPASNEQRKADVEGMVPAFVVFLRDPRSLDVPIAHLRLISDESDKKIELREGRISALPAHQRGVAAHDASRS